MIRIDVKESVGGRFIAEIIAKDSHTAFELLEKYLVKFNITKYYLRINNE